MTRATPLILVVDDDPSIRQALTRELALAGYEAVSAADGVEGKARFEERQPDLVITDLAMPRADGLALLAAVRRVDATPVLVLSVRGEEEDKVRALDAGADDYVTKPFRLEEVLARVRALIRRASGHSSPILECGPVSLDTNAARVTVEGRPIKLTSQEYRLLEYMMHHRDKVVSRTELTEHLYDQDFDRDSNLIEVFVGRLRKKIGVDFIVTVRGLGYRLSAGDTSVPR